MGGAAHSRFWRSTYLNANAKETIGGGRDLIGRVLWDVFPGAAATKSWDLKHRAASERQPARYEFFEPDLGKWFLNVNPFTHLAISYQEVLFFRGPFGHWRWLLVLGVMSVAFFLFAYFVFDRLRDTFAEEV